MSADSTEVAATGPENNARSFGTRASAGRLAKVDVAESSPAIPADTDGQDAMPDAGASVNLLGRDDILNLEDRRYEIIRVAAWGNRLVRIQSLKAKERDRYEASINEQKKDGSQVVNFVQARAKLCVLTLVNANGDRLFGDSDVGKLGEKNAEAVNEIWTASCKLSGIMKKDVDELVGNSAGDRSGDSL